MIKIDRAAHDVADFWRDNLALADVPDDDLYLVIYHEDRLYSVYDRKNDIMSLVYAGSREEARSRVKGRGVTMNIKQIGGNGKVIGYVENMTL